jgi:hypothetical protein
MGQVIRGTLPALAHPAPAQRQQPCAAEKAQERHDDPAHHTAVPQSQLCNKCRRHKSRSQYRHYTGGLTGAAQLSGLRLCGAARRNRQQDGHRQRGIPQPDGAHHTQPGFSVCKQGQIDHAAHAKNYAQDYRSQNQQIHRVSSFDFGPFSGIHPRKRKFLQCIHHIAFAAEKQACAACFCAFLLPGAGTLSL